MLRDSFLHKQLQQPSNPTLDVSQIGLGEVLRAEPKAISGNSEASAAAMSFKFVLSGRDRM